MAGRSQDSEPPLSPGTTVGHYEILRELGHGGMGVIYVARDRTLGRKVALKRPAPERAADPEFQRRFLRESRSASAIDHPHVVTVFEGFEHRGVPWLAMALIEGATLRQRLSRGGPFSLEETLRHGVELSGALQAAHARGILHRDINPNNVMISADGRALLADFGLAGAWAAPGRESAAPTRTPELTRSGRLFGTPGYMSPEQERGGKVDPRGDIYSLGLVLSEMCTGRRRAETSGEGELARAIHTAGGSSRPRVSREIPPELERILRQATARRPEDRHPTAADLHRELEALRRRQEALDYGDETGPDARTVRRYRAGYLFLATALLALAAAWLFHEAGKRRRALPEAVPRQVTTGVGWEADPALSPDGSLIAYASAASGNSDIWLVDASGGRPIRLTDDEAAETRPAWNPDGSAVLYVSTRGGGSSIWSVPRLGGAPTLVLEDARDPAVSPEGGRIAFARISEKGSGTRIFVAPRSDPGRATQLTRGADGMWDHVGPAWSPDGKTLCYADFRNLWLVPAAGGTARRLTADDAGDFHATWSTDGRHIYFASYREGTLALWRIAAAGGEVERLTTGTGPESQPSLSLQGRRLTYSTIRDDPDLVYVDLASGERIEVSDARVDTAPAIAPDASAVAFTSDRRGGRFDLWVQPLAGGQPSGSLRRLTDQAGSASHPTYSPDGAWIAYQRTLHGERDLWIVSAAGGAAVRFTTATGPDIHAAWSPGGDRIAFVSERDGPSRIWVAPVRDGRPAGEAARVTHGEEGVDLSPAWSPDGGEIAFVCAVPGGEEVCAVPGDGSRPPRVLTAGAGARQVHWDAASGRLYVSGSWGKETVTLRTVPPEGGDAVPVEPPIVFGRGDPYPDFDVSGEHSLLVFTQEERTGDVWLLETQDGMF